MDDLEIEAHRIGSSGPQMNGTASVAKTDSEAVSLEQDGSEEDRPEYLRPELRHYQIFFIIISAVIGTSAFNTAGQVLALAGPVGLLVAVILTGAIAASTGETIGEMVQVFRVPNAIYEYIAAWVDEDIAWVAGIMYWYCWATILPEEMLSAAALIKYWNLETPWPPLIFYFLVPLFFVALNLFPVYVYGWIETVGGALKSLLLIVVSCIMFAVSQQDGNHPYIAAGLTDDGLHALSPAKAFCYGVPTIVLGFLGIESIAVAAFEARSHNDIVYPALWVHWIVYAMYFFVTVGIVVSVWWKNPELPSIFGNTIHGRDLNAVNATSSLPSHNTSSPTILAMESLSSNLAGFVNACLIFSVMSAGNTAIYYSSRTLWGLTYNLQERNRISRWFKKLSPLMASSGAPIRTIFFSWLLFFWLPWLELVPSNAQVLEVLSLSSSISCLLVWLTLMVAFLRYKKWTTLCAKKLEEEGYGKYVRNTKGYRKMAKNYLMLLQPGFALFAAAGILFIFILCSALWWDTTATAAEIFAVFGPHMVAVILVLLIKFFRGTLNKWLVPLNPDGKDLIKRIQYLEFIANTRY
ncbi:hypothetical protein N431DRAFT_486595 [Stipitochalara longipes BDJ]|nr:hypothetical protein N431DRAFT_486595 [Stipitochalara longipes BDJ]